MRPRQWLLALVAAAIAVALAALLLRCTDETPSAAEATGATPPAAEGTDPAAAAAAPATATPTRTLAITLVVDDGSPADSVLLTGPDSLEVRTDPDGIANVAGPGTYTYERADLGRGTLTVSADDAQPFELPRISELRVEVECRGVAVRRIDAAPIARDLAEFQRNVRGRGRDRRVRAPIVASGSLDAQNSVTLALHYGPWSFSVPRAEVRLAPAATTIDRPQATLHLLVTADPAERLSGHVFDERGEPIAGASLHLPGNPIALATTATDGTYEVPRHGNPDLPSFDVRAPGNTFAPVLSCGPFAWGTTDNDVRLARRGAFWLRCTRDGALLPMGWVAALHPPRPMWGLNPHDLVPEPSGLAPLPDATTDANWLVVSAPPDIALARLDELPRERTRAGTVATLVATTPTNVTVTAQDEAGQPLAGLTVHSMLAADAAAALRAPIVDAALFRPGQPPFGNALRLGSTRTDSAGIATLSMPRSPHAFLRIDPPQGHLPVVVAAPSCPTTVTVPTVWMLRGTIDPPCPSAPAGLAALSATQCSLRARHLDSDSASPVFASTALRGGRYTIVGLRPGRHRIDYLETESGRCRVWPLGEVEVHGDTQFDLQRTLPRAAVRARVHGIDATSTLLDLVRDSGEPAAQAIPVRDGFAEFEITPGTYEVRTRATHPDHRLPYFVKAEGRYAWDGGEPPAWEITFRDEPGELIVVGADGQPLARTWFAIASHLCLLPSDAAGRIALPTWPGDEFTIRRATLVDGIWQHGPAARVLRGQQRVVVQDQ